MNSPPDVRTPGEVGTDSRALREEDAAIVADVKRTDKDEAKLIAIAALAGFELRKLAAGRWLVSRWNLRRELLDTAAVRVFLAGAGVRA